MQWLRDSLGIIKSTSEIDGLASQVDSSGEVYFVPAFNGLFAPWWRDVARRFVLCIGITRFTNKAHIARSVLESMCFQVKDVLDSMHKDAGGIKNDGVFAQSGWWSLLMQNQADLLGKLVVRPADIETTVLGAAYAAGFTVGKIWTEDHIFSSGEKMEKSTTFCRNYWLFIIFTKDAALQPHGPEMQSAEKDYYS